MPHPYDTRPSFDKFLGAPAVARLLDLDNDGTEDVGLYDQIREEADAEIDVRLAQRYGTTFGTLDAEDATFVAKISNHLAAAFLFSKRHEDSPSVEWHLAQATRYLDGLLDGRYELTSASKVDAASASHGLDYSADTPTVSGRDSTGKSRMSKF